jgi:hypothetical protein
MPPVDAQRGVESPSGKVGSPCTIAPPLRRFRARPSRGTVRCRRARGEVFGERRRAEGGCEAVSAVRRASDLHDRESFRRRRELRAAIAAGVVVALSEAASGRAQVRGAGGIAYCGSTVPRGQARDTCRMRRCRAAVPVAGRQVQHRDPSAKRCAPSAHDAGAGAGQPERATAPRVGMSEGEVTRVDRLDRPARVAASALTDAGPHASRHDHGRASRPRDRGHAPWSSADKAATVRRAWCFSGCFKCRGRRRTSARSDLASPCWRPPPTTRTTIATGSRIIV